MPAPVASGWSGCRVGLAPTGKRRLSRRTRKAEIARLTHARLSPAEARGPMSKPGIPPHWKPTLGQLETIAEMAGAQATPDAMAAAVDLSLDEFIAWRRRSLAAARAEEERYANPEPIPEPKPVAAAVSPRVVVDRAFERAGEERRGAATICSH